jgi:hypothetical protein
MKTRIGRPLVALTIVGLASLIFYGCAPTKLPLRADVEPMKLRKLPMAAALVIPDSLKQANDVHDINCAGTYSVPIGVELENTLNQAFSQVFDSVDFTADRAQVSGLYDVVLEVSKPTFEVEGHCLTRRFLYLTGPFYLFFDPTDTYEGRASLHITVSDNKGQVLQDETFKSRPQTKDTLFATGTDRMNSVATVMRDSLLDTIQQMVRGVAGSPQVGTYARKFIKPSGEKGTVKTARMILPSDVDVPPLAEVKAQKNRYAVVIGVEQYRQGLASVEFASHDARVMRDYLTKSLGYPEENVVTLTDEQAAKSDIEKYIERWLPNRVEAGSSVLVYYSGHGAPNPITQESFLVPYDGDPTFLEVTGYSLKRLYEQLGKLPAKNVVVMLDSCFSGTGERSVIAKGMRPAVINVENPLLAGEKIVVLSAGTGAQTSSTYHQKSHGLFTYFVLKGLQGAADGNQDHKVDVAELYAYLKPQVQGVARREFNNDQAPQLLGHPDLLRNGMPLVDLAR